MSQPRKNLTVGHGRTLRSPDHDVITNTATVLQQKTNRQRAITNKTQNMMAVQATVALLGHNNRSASVPVDVMMSSGGKEEFQHEVGGLGAATPPLPDVSRILQDDDEGDGFEASSITDHEEEVSLLHSNEPRTAGKRRTRSDQRAQQQRQTPRETVHVGRGHVGVRNAAIRREGQDFFSTTMPLSTSSVGGMTFNASRLSPEGGLSDHDKKSRFGGIVLESQTAPNSKLTGTLGLSAQHPLLPIASGVSPRHQQQFNSNKTKNATTSSVHRHHPELDLNNEIDYSSALYKELNRTSVANVSTENGKRRQVVTDPQLEQVLVNRLVRRLDGHDEAKPVDHSFLEITNKLEPSSKARVLKECVPNGAQGLKTLEACVESNAALPSLHALKREAIPQHSRGVATEAIGSELQKQNLLLRASSRQQQHGKRGPGGGKKSRKHGGRGTADSDTSSSRHLGGSRPQTHLSLLPDTVRLRAGGTALVPTKNTSASNALQLISATSAAGVGGGTGRGELFTREEEEVLIGIFMRGATQNGATASAQGGRRNNNVYYSMGQNYQRHHQSLVNAEKRRQVLHQHQRQRYDDESGGPGARSLYAQENNSSSNVDHFVGKTQSSIKLSKVGRSVTPLLPPR